MEIRMVEHLKEENGVVEGWGLVGEGKTVTQFSWRLLSGWRISGCHFQPPNNKNKRKQEKGEEREEGGGGEVRKIVEKSWGKIRRRENERKREWKKRECGWWLNWLTHSCVRPAASDWRAPVCVTRRIGLSYSNHPTTPYHPLIHPHSPSHTLDQPPPLPPPLLFLLLLLLFFQMQPAGVAEVPKLDWLGYLRVLGCHSQSGGFTFWVLVPIVAYFGKYWLWFCRYA